MKSARFERRRIIITCCLTVGFLLSCILAGVLLEVKDDIQKSDAIIVIGGDHKPARVKHAVELYEQGYAPIVIISAGTIVLEGDRHIREAEVMQRLALEFGLPNEVMVLEKDSLSTFENAYYSNRICQEYDLRSILLVTSAYHSRRSRKIFREVMEPAISVSVQPSPQEFRKLSWWLYPDQMYVVFYEYYNWIHYWLSRL